MAEETQDGQKTIVAFVVGLLIGGMLVWAFSGPTADAPATQSEDESATETSETNNDSTGTTVTDTSETNESSDEVIPTLQVGNGEVTVQDQKAASSVQLESATYPISEGWIGIREYNNDQLGYILGVVRFSEAQGLVPSEIVLQRATTPGNRYAVVIFTEDGDLNFSLANDVQIDTIFDTFVAQ